MSTNMGGQKVWMGVSVVLLISLILVALFPIRGGSDEVVATVNGEKITKNTLYDNMVKISGKNALNSLINEKLVSQKLKEAGLTITDEDVQAELDRIIKDFGSEEQFAMMLEYYYGIPLDVYKQEIRVQAMLRKLLEPQTNVTDEEISQYYEENKDQFVQTDQVRASHILVKTREEAEAILAELKAGADFGELAKAKSTDTATAESGGDLDFFGRGIMDPAFEEAAFALEVGEISDIVESGFGYHIIKVTDKIGEYLPPLEEKAYDIREILLTQELTELSKHYMDELYATANIETFLD